MASPDYVFIRRYHPIKDGGLSHSDTRASKPVDGSARLVAVFRVLRRLPMPRHPSCARIRLARKFVSSSVIANLDTLQFSLISNLPIFKDRRPLHLAWRLSRFTHRVERAHIIPQTRFAAQGGILKNFSIVAWISKVEFLWISKVERC